MQTYIKLKKVPIWLLLTFLMVASPLWADSARQILLINSYHDTYPWSHNVSASIFRSLQQSEFEVELHREYLDSKRFEPEEVFPAFYELLKNKFTEHAFEVIVLVDNNALAFYRQYGKDLFPGVPVVFCGINNFTTDMLSGLSHITGVSENPDFAGTIETILKLQPQVETIAFVTCTVETAKIHRVNFLTAAGPFANRVDFLDLHEMVPSELMTSLFNLKPETSVVVTLSYQKDPEGTTYDVEETIRLIAESGLPQYSCWEQYLHPGVVGGIMVDANTHGSQAAEMVLRILRGEQAEDIPVEKSSSQAIFDYQQLIKFGISPANLPEGAQILNSPDVFWNKYQEYLLAGTVIILVMLGLILFLIANVLRRKRTQQTLEAILNSLPDLVLMHDYTGKILFANPAAAARLGYDHEQLMKKSISEVEEPEFAKSYSDRMNFVHQHGKHGRQGQYVSRAGTVFDVDTKTSQVLFDSRHVVLSVARDITDLKQTEYALRESQYRLNILFQQAADAIFLCDRKGRLIEVNEQACRSTGHTRQELLTMYATDVDVETTTPEALERFVEQLLQSGESVIVETRHQRKDGSSFPVEMTLSPLETPGQPCVMGIARDITKRKGALEALEESNRMFRGTFEQAAVGVAHVSPDGSFTRINQRFCDIVGYTHEEMVEKTFQEITHPKDLDADLAYVNQLFEGEIEHYSMEKRYFHKKGHVVWVNLTVALMQREDGSPEYMISVVEDISDRKAAEQALLESEVRFRELFQNMDSAVVIYEAIDDGQDFIFKDINPAGERIGQTSREDHIGKRILDVYPGLKESGLFDVIQSVWKTSNPEKVPVTAYEDQSLSLWIDSYICKIPTGEIVAVYNDITEQKQSEQALLESEVRFRELFENMGSGVAVYEVQNDGQDFIFKDINPAGARIGQIPREEHLGRNVRDVYPGLAEIGLIDVFRNVWETGNPQHHPMSAYEDERVSLWVENYVCKLPTGEIVAVYDDITERKQAEEALRESEQRFRNFIELAPDPIFIHDREGKIHVTNQAACNTLGYAPEELAQMNIIDVEAALNSVEDVHHVLDQVHEKKTMITYGQHVRKDGSTYPVEVNLACLGGDNPHLALAMARDISVRQKYEQEIRESEQRLNSIFTSAPVGIGMVVNRVLTRVNDRFCEITGYSSQELCGKSARILYPTQEDYDYVGKEKYRQIGERGTGSVETRFRKKNGEIINVILSSTPLDSEDWSRGVTFTAMDITARKKMEDELRQSEQQIRSVFRSTPVGIGQAKDRIILRVNDRLCEMIGRSSEELLGQDTSILYPTQEEYERIGREHYHDIREKGIAQSESQIMRKDGTILDVLISSARLDAHDPAKGITFSISDITTIKSVEKELRRSEQLLRDTGRIARIGGWQLDSQTRQLTMTPETREIHELEPEQTITLEEAIDFYDPQAVPVIRQAVTECLENGVPFEHELEFITAKGRHIWIHAEGQAYRDANGDIERIGGTFQDVTDRVLARKAIEESEEKYRLLFETSAEGVVIMDEAVRDANQRSLEMFEVTYDEMIGKAPWELSPETQPDGKDSKIAAFEFIERAMKGETVSFDWTSRSVKGRLFDVIVTLKPLVIRGQQLLLASIRDITDRKQAEREIRETSHRLSSILDSISDGFFALNEDMIVTYYNSAAERLLNNPAENVIGKKIFEECFPEAAGSVFEEKYQQALESKEMLIFEVYFDTPPYENWYNVRVYPFEDGISIYFQITTEQKLAQAMIRESEKNYRTLVENLQEGIWRFDQEDRTTFVNPAMAEMLGYEPEEMMNKTPDEFILPSEYEQLIQFTRQIHEGMAVRAESTYLHKEGDWVSMLINAAPSFDEQGNYKGMLAAMTNISERKELEHQRESLMRNLELKNKELESIIYVASHDLRSPLVNIQGFSSELVTDFKEMLGILAKIEIPLNQRAVLNENLLRNIPDSLKYITMSVKKMDILLRGLLKVSRMGRATINLRRVNINQLLEEVIASLQYQINKTDAEVVIQPDMPRCQADYTQLTHVFSNLIDNAVKYLDPSRSGRIEIFGAAEDSMVTYCIRDNGIGISEGHQDRIFEIFHRLDPSGPIQGEGLGLTIVKRIIDRLGGTVTLESEPGQGTSFYITLPTA